MQGHLYIISAPSGTGKTSLVKSLLANTDNLQVSVSHTTRPARDGEVHGVNYYFVEKAEFETMLAENTFLEHATVFGNYYGTSKTWVDSKLQQGIDIILEIDWQGAEKVRQLMPEAISIFILPPSKQALSERLYGRGKDSAEVIQRRLQAAIDEMRHCHEFDYLVVNDDFNQALQELQTIIHCQRLKQSVQQSNLSKLLQGLLSD
ncbi:guanylate kinase [Candidatus Albibeggiatoa sp. nov. NOAA]|uniref:guanylate kinase n=1 Tax=Candidatus Albibeggiatoa sp. nov. NOAA TaxID=3162724 RepID=UPI0032FD4BE3|nr:guanylate kinase [Thiotrichaceae bacterium]